MSIQRRVCQHLRASGLSSTNSSRLASLTQKWVRENGVEWTAERWKSLSTYAHQRLIDPSTPIPEGWKSRRNRSGKRILADGALHRYLEFGGDPSPRSLMQMEAICRISSVLFNRRPTVKAIYKAISSIVEPSIEIPSIDSRIVDEFVENIISRCDISELHEARKRIIPLRSTLPSRKSSPFYEYDQKTSHYVMKTGPRSEIKVISPTLCRIDPELYHIMCKDLRFTSFVFTGNDEAWSISPDYREMDYILRNQIKLPIGRLSLLNKDGSAKIRVIASPIMEIQCALSPLKNVLMYFLYHDRCSAVHDQQRGREDISKWLKRGLRCYGFDQSAFTDRFPYALQRTLLDNLLRRNFFVSTVELDLLDLCVARPWRIPQMMDLDVTYAVGQGMGINPSFPLATLSHIMVCYNLAKPLGLATHLYRYVRIVGDDIVISDDRLAESYQRFMVDKCHVKINLQKSLISDRFTSFCGKIIGSEGIVPATKIRPIKSEASLVEKIRHYGKSAISLFSNEMEKYGKRITLPYPYGYDIHPDSLPYRDWLNTRPYGNTQARVINNEVRDFIGSYSRLTPELLERQLAWDRDNRRKTLPDGSPSITQELRVSTRFDEKLRTFRQEDGTNSENSPPTTSFKDIVDASVREDLEFLDKIEDEITLLDYRQYTNSVGYIENNQRPSMKTGIPPIINDDQEDESRALPMELIEKRLLVAIKQLKELSNGQQHPEDTFNGKYSRGRAPERCSGSSIFQESLNAKAKRDSEEAKGHEDSKPKL